MSDQAKTDLQKLFKAQKPPHTCVLNFPSDTAGCGFYRTFIPFSYLISKSNFVSPFLFGFNFDITYISNMDWLRFQRQTTHRQKSYIYEYKKLITKNNFKTRITFDLDDLVHEIEPCNIEAYRYYTQTRKNNLIDLFNMSDVVTFSTQFLKDYYEEKHNVKNSVVIPNFLPKHLWYGCGKRNKFNASKKMRIFWSGSSSHISRGGDMEFLLPLIYKTINEFEWVFMGTMPPELLGKVEFHEWEDFYDYPQKMDEINADVGIIPIKDHIFNYAKSDLKLLEFTAMGLPCLCSSIGKGIGPYDLINGVVTVENRVEEWYQALKKFEKDLNFKNNSLEAGRSELNKRWMENPENYGLYEKTFKIK
jgi:hypothetical protein